MTAFLAALTHAEFSHLERIVQGSEPVIVAYRYDPASAAGKGWLASLRESEVRVG